MYEKEKETTVDEQRIIVAVVLDAQTQNGDEPVGEYSFLGQSCLSSVDSWWNG